MNKFLILTIALALTMLILPNVSAFEFDNVKSYDTIAREVTFKNSFLGIPTSDIAKAKLDTPLVNYVMPGSDRKVAEITIESYTDYTNFIKSMELTDLRTGKKITRPITYKYNSPIEVTVKEYIAENCYNSGKDIVRISKITGKEEVAPEVVCNRKVVPEHKELKDNWIPLEKLDIKAEKITIGIFTEVLPEDNVEWVPNLFGLKVTEWATWTSALTQGLVVFYKADDTGSGLKDALGVLNMSPMRSPTYSNTGIINKSVNTWPGYFNISGSNKFDMGANNFAVSFWLYSEQAWTGNGNRYPIQFNGHASDSNTPFMVEVGTDWKLGMYVSTAGTCNGMATDESNLVLTNGSWYHVVISRNSTAWYYYLNGTRDSHTYSNTGTLTTACTDKSTKIGGYGSNTDTQNWNGRIDEVGIWNRSLTDAEVVDLYNAGAGITYSEASPPLSITTTLNSPDNVYNTSSTSVTFSANATAISGNVTNMTLYLWGGVLVKNTTTGLTSSTNTSSWVMAGLTDYLYTWNVLSCAVDASNYTCAFSTNRTLRVDTTGPTVNITYPLNNSEIVTFIPSNNISLNFTASDSGVGLSSCLYSIDGGVATPIVCGTNASENFTSGYHSVTYISNDLLSNSANITNTFFINYVRPTVNYSLTGVELENTTFYFNLTADNITQANATIRYNNTNYLMDIGSYNSTNAGFYKVITLPEVSADTVKQFNITYYLNNVQYNTTVYNQTVYNIPALNISAGLCAGTPVYWFTLQDEANLTLVSGDFEYNFYYGLSNSSMVRTYGKVSGATNFSICTNTTINPNWTIGSGEILYRSTGYVDRRYYIFDNTVVTSASNFTLYDLLSTTQTSFKLEIEDTSLNPYDNIYNRLLRWYPDLNEYKIVDMGKTDETGSTVIHVRTEDVDYRIGAYYTNGTLIYLAQPIRMVCLASPCTYTLKISPGEVDYTSFLNIVYTFTYNETTGIWNFVYSDTTGKTSTMNLTVYRLTGTTEYAVCSQSISGAVGALTCNTSAYTTGILRGEVYRSASPPVEIVQKVVHLFTSAFKGSSFGLWLSMLLALPVIFLLCLVSPIGALLGGIIALLPALYFGSINIGIVGGLAVLAGIVAHFLKRVS